MSQFVSSFSSFLGGILPFRSDTPPLKCPYIVNRGKEGEYICGAMSQSGLLCAKHKKCKPQVHEVDEDKEEEEEERPPTERSKNKGRRTRESTPVTSTPSRPRTARSKPASPSATETPTRPKTAPNKSSSTSAATDTPTSTELSNTPRRSTRKSTPKATPKPASTRKLRSSLPGPDSTPPHTLTGTSNDGIEELTGRLKELNVISSDDTEEQAGRIEDLNIEDEDDIEAIHSARESLNMPKRVNTAESVVSFSYGTGGPLSSYLMEGIKDDVSVAAKIIKELPKPPRSDDGSGYVYIFLVTPKPSFQINTDNKKTSTAASEKGINSEEKMIIKVGSARDPGERMKGLCVYYKYETRGVFPKEKGKKIVFRYKAERMAQIQLQNWLYDLPNGRCQCDIKHQELFHVTQKQLEAVFRCVEHWATVVNADHEKLWPGAVERNRKATVSQQAD